MGSFKNILIHVDGRDECRGLIDCGIQLARDGDAALKLVDVLPHASWPTLFASGESDRFLQQLADAKQARLRQLASEHESEGITVTYRVLQAPTSVALIREAIQGQHDLVIKSVKGQKSRRLGFFGTTAKRLLRKCPVPVLMVKPEFEGPFRHIVAAVDAVSAHQYDAELNRHIIQLAQELCPEQTVPQLIQVWSLYGESILKEHTRPEELEKAKQKVEMHAERCLDDLLVGMGMGVGKENVHLIQGDPIDAIPGFVDEHPTDLLVMGTVGRSGVAGLLMGNTAEQILERVACSVLAVKPADFVSPIRLAD